MKKAFVSDLTSEQTITSFFLVSAKELRNTKEGKPYLRLELCDRSGTVEARMWTKFESAAQEVAREDIVKIEARVELYRDRTQLALLQIRKARPEAKVMHHAYLGGLLEHVIGLCGLAKQVAAHYQPELDVDLLVTAAILHDVGKLDELCYERSIGYTTHGQLLGHIVMEVETVGKAIDKIEGFPPELKIVVQHLLISHHGEYEFGSPKLPMIREALVFHYLDDLDSKMAAARAALAGESGDEEWSVYSGALQRKFLKLDRYLQPAESRPADLTQQSPAKPEPVIAVPSAPSEAVQLPLQQVIEKAGQGS
jgi:3'-5' exoribonuclease